MEYCIDGTLLAIAAAPSARHADKRLRSTSFFAAQTDFTEADELMLVINGSQLAFLEDVMWKQRIPESEAPSAMRSARGGCGMSQGRRVIAE